MNEFKPTTVPGEEPVLSENALAVLRARYLTKDDSGTCIETPGQLLSRVAEAVAKAETKYGADPARISKWHKQFYDMMASLRFLPNSPALMNANRPNGMLSACFVLPIEDSIEAIFETVKQTALIQKAGGGTGFSFDKLRPTGDRVASSGGTTSGPISFWRVFCQTTDAIQQGAFRRGANMGMMGLDHPDILKFLYAKQTLKAFTNFNISVKVTDQWMEMLDNSPHTAHTVTNPRTQETFLLPKSINIEDSSINDLHKLTGKAPKVSGSKPEFYSVGDIWKIILKCAHKTGEPGLAFIDRINRDNPTPSLGQIEATNPCGEQPLLPYEACTLGSINLAKFVTFDQDRAQIDWPALAETVKLAVHFLDNTIDASTFPVRNTVALAQANRKIGLGIMGLADCLFLLEIPYDCDQAVALGEDLMKFISANARDASVALADLRGPFPNWNQSTWRTEKKQKIRNASVTCVAPTGTISILADCCGGIEPAYSLIFLRQILDGAKLIQINPIFHEVAQKNDFFSKKLQEQIISTGSIQKIAQIPTNVRKIFKCAYDIKPEWHIRMQAAFQNNCDAAVSKTVNFPEKTSVGTVEKAFKLAYHLGCKGITIYRRKARRDEPMSLV